VMLLVFVGVPPLADLLGGSMPSASGWLLAATAIPVVWAADTAMKAVRAARSHRRAHEARAQAGAQGRAPAV
ncbi:MAG: hypothetical protein HGA44_21905, partial [Cellulomonadaceae bacterium]|nr:hypothetical protein [Cellulomonadaceae bacterium]